jgi:hypothetical protein
MLTVSGRNALRLYDGETCENRGMRQKLENGAWIAAFIALCAIFAYQVVVATRAQQAAAAARQSGATGAPWVCPIAGQCGPPGTPGLGRW